MIEYVLSHLKSASSYMAALLSIVGVLMASGLLGQGTLLHIAGYLVAVLTTLGFKALPQPSVQPAA